MTSRMSWLGFVASRMLLLGFAIVFCSGFGQTDLDEDQVTCETGTCATKGQTMLQTRLKTTVDETSTACYGNSVEFYGNCYATMNFADPDKTGTNTRENDWRTLPRGWEIATYSDDLAEYLMKFGWGTYGLYLKNPEDPAYCVESCSSNLFSVDAQNCKKPNAYGFEYVYAGRVHQNCMTFNPPPNRRRRTSWRSSLLSETTSAEESGGYGYYWYYYFDADRTPWPTPPPTPPTPQPPTPSPTPITYYRAGGTVSVLIICKGSTCASPSLPTPMPTPSPTPSPTASPTPTPTPLPTESPTLTPTPLPTASPTLTPTPLPTPLPTLVWTSSDGTVTQAYAIMPDKGYCKNGYYRGNCKAKTATDEDIAACVSVDTCFAQCAKESQCKFAAYKKNVCARYDERAGDCTGDGYRKGNQQLFRKER